MCICLADPWYGLGRTIIKMIASVSNRSLFVALVALSPLTAPSFLQRVMDRKSQTQFSVCVAEVGPVLVLLS